MTAAASLAAVAAAAPPPVPLALGAPPAAGASCSAIDSPRLSSSNLRRGQTNMQLDAGHQLDAAAPPLQACACSHHTAGYHAALLSQPGARQGARSDNEL